MNMHVYVYMNMHVYVYMNFKDKQMMDFLEAYIHTCKWIHNIHAVGIYQLVCENTYKTHKHTHGFTHT